MGGRILGAALILGAGAVALGVIVAGPPLMRVSRPALRAGLRRGLEIYALARTRVEEAAEDLGDLIAEVHDEVMQSRTPTPHARASEKNPAQARAS